MTKSWLISEPGLISGTVLFPLSLYFTGPFRPLQAQLRQGAQLSVVTSPMFGYDSTFLALLRMYVCVIVTSHLCLFPSQACLPKGEASCHP